MAKFPRFSDVSGGFSLAVSSKLVGPAIYVFSIEQILRDLPKMSQLLPSFITKNLWKTLFSAGRDNCFLATGNF